MGVMTLDFVYSGVLCSDLRIIKNFVDEILNKINPIVEDEETMFDIRLILNELIVNGIMHGNECINSKCVKLLIEIKERRLKIQVEDEGKGVNFDIMSYDPDELNTYGRGLVLVNGLSDEFYIQKNKVVAIKQLY